jgi:hypothetical protein
MPNKKLVGYIQEQLKAGYNLNLIRNYLIKYGYTYKDIDEALQEVYHPEVKHVVHHISKTTLIAVAIIGLIVVLLIPTIYHYISGSSTPKQLLDLRTSSLKNEVYPGEKLEFNIELSNAGRSKRYDVLVRSEIIGTDIFKEETIAVETTTSKTSYVQLPDDIALRKYTLKTTASYADKKAFSTFGFTVSKQTGSNQQSCNEQWSCGAWQPAVCPSSGQQTRTCTDTNRCGTNYDKPGISQSCTYEQEPTQDVRQPVQQPNSGMTIWQQLDAIKEKAKTDPNGAKRDCSKMAVDSHKDECYSNVAAITLDISLCEEISGERAKDTCFGEIAKLTADSEICERIFKTTRKDSCYMNFVNNKDYTVCEKIDNSYLKEACFALRDMPDIVVS